MLLSSMLSTCHSNILQAEPTAESPKRPKSPGILAKLLAPFKHEKAKVEKKVKEKTAAKKTEKKEGEVSSIIICVVTRV